MPGASNPSPLIRGRFRAVADLDYWLTLRGRSSKLVRVGSTNVFRLADDPFWRIERKFTASGNGDSEGEWWEVRTGDGTVYEFGRNARSLSRVLVYSQYVCPGWFAFHLCQKGWEWNLDVVRDGNGNEVRYRYEPEKNYFTPELVPGFASPVPVQYDRASQLRSITYTQATQSANARVVFDWELRCGDVDTYGTCSIFGIDAPWDLWCRTPSTNCRLSPSFWSGARLGSIVTQVRDGAGGWTTRAVHDLVQSQPAPPNDTAASSGARTMLYRIHRRPGGRFERFGFDQMPVVDGTIAAGTPVRAHNGEDLDSESYAKFKVGDRIRLDDVYLGEPAARASAVTIRYATRRSHSAANPNEVEVLSGSTVLATVALNNTGSWIGWRTVTVPVTANGIADISIRGKATAGPAGSNIAHISWVRFQTPVFDGLESAPPVDFYSGGDNGSGGFAWLANRAFNAHSAPAPWNPPAGVSAQYMARIETVRNELGGETTFSYGTPAGCHIANLAAPGWDRSHRHCYAAVDHFTNPGPPVDYVVFHKHVVTATVRDDGTNPTVRTTYAYGTPRWAKAVGAGTSGTYHVFRGHDKVTVDTAGTRVQYRFFQGMEGENNEASQPLDVTRSDNTTFDDDGWLRGRVFEVRHLEGVNTHRRREWTTYHTHMTATSGSDKAYFVAPATTETVTNETVGPPADQDQLHLPQPHRQPDRGCRSRPPPGRRVRQRRRTLRLVPVRDQHQPRGLDPQLVVRNESLVGIVSGHDRDVDRVSTPLLRRRRHPLRHTHRREPDPNPDLPGPHRHLPNRRHVLRVRHQGASHLDRSPRTGIEPPLPHQL